MVIMRWKSTYSRNFLAASFLIVPRPAYLLRPCPAAQVRWSSATTEPRQSGADGRTQGGPSPQNHIAYTSESYAVSALGFCLALTYVDLGIPRSNGMVDFTR